MMRKHHMDRGGGLFRDVLPGYMVLLLYRRHMTNSSIVAGPLNRSQQLLKLGLLVEAIAINRVSVCSDLARAFPIA